MAVISWRQDIVLAQVDAEKDWQKQQNLRMMQMLIVSLSMMEVFWHCLRSIVDNLEPISLGINMNQTDSMCPDQVLITFAGIFSYFQKHAKPAIATGMMMRIEKCWKALDQLMFVLTLVLNPFEGVSHFGDKAAVSLFILNTVS